MLSQRKRQLNISDLVVGFKQFSDCCSFSNKFDRLIDSELYQILVMQQRNIVYEAESIIISRVGIAIRLTEI
jgi:hypothetical protein